MQQKTPIWQQVDSRILGLSFWQRPSLVSSGCPERGGRREEHPIPGQKKNSMLLSLQLSPCTPREELAASVQIAPAHFWLKKTPRSPNPLPPCPLNHVPQCHMSTFLEHSKDDDSTTSLGILFGVDYLCNGKCKGCQTPWKQMNQLKLWSRADTELEQHEFHELAWISAPRWRIFSCPALLSDFL